jgi:hypothetical protein
MVNVEAIRRQMAGHMPQSQRGTTETFGAIGLPGARGTMVEPRGYFSPMPSQMPHWRNEMLNLRALAEAAEGPAVRTSGQGEARQGEEIAARKDQDKTRRTKRRLEESDKEADRLKCQVYQVIQELHAGGKKPADILSALKADPGRMEQVRGAGLQANKKLIRAALALPGQRERDAASRRKNQDSSPP